MQLKRIITLQLLALITMALVSGASLSAQSAQDTGTQNEMTGDTTRQPAAAMQLTLEPILTTGIMERMPVDSLGDNATVTADSVFFWTRVDGVTAGDSTSITHVWTLDGQKVFTRELPVKGPGWRTWTYNVIGPGQSGDWTVTAYGPNGAELASMQFTATKSQEAEPMKESTPADSAGMSESPGGKE